MRFRAAVLVLSSISWIGTASAQTEELDQYDLVVRGETHAQLFRRALLPGPRGTLVATDTVAPVHQYLSLEAHDLDTSWQKDSLDVELAAWGRGFVGEREGEHRLDGDVQSANVRYRQGPVSLRLGRQLVAGGAARFVRFDGARVGAELDTVGLDADAYAGFTALPRWDEQPGYHLLGDASDSLVRDPSALQRPDRAKHWLGGGRLGWTSDVANASASFHEQHEQTGLSRRSLGADAGVRPFEQLEIGANALLELDAERFQDFRVWADATPLQPLDMSVEYLHTEPALFLSRQSVLSVFSTDAYDEAGGSLELDAASGLRLEAGGWAQIYDTEDQGARGELAARIEPGQGKRTLVRVAYARVLAPDNGYHSVRCSLLRRLTPKLKGTLEAYAYLYDEPIAGRITSTVYAGTLGYQATDAFDVLWGASVAQSPYAELDAQTLLRAAYAFDFSNRGLR